MCIHGISKIALNVKVKKIILQGKKNAIIQNIYYIALTKCNISLFLSFFSNYNKFFYIFSPYVC